MPSQDAGSTPATSTIFFTFYIQTILILEKQGKISYVNLYVKQERKNLSCFHFYSLIFGNCFAVSRTVFRSSLKSVSDEAVIVSWSFFVLFSALYQAPDSSRLKLR